MKAMAAVTCVNASLFVFVKMSESDPKNEDRVTCSAHRIGECYASDGSFVMCVCYSVFFGARLI